MDINLYNSLIQNSTYNRADNTNTSSDTLTVRPESTESTRSTENIDKDFLPGNKIKEDVFELSSNVERPKQNMASKKVMMDLNEMKSFLFMLIGSSIRVEPETNMTGSNFNTLA
ncbi:MAG: hypothetical protein GY754_17695 [bacterium]|nr:hypothetical protein [bacterium]